MTKSYLGVSEHVVYPFLPNGFADHYPKNKWLFHWEYTLFSDKPMWLYVAILCGYVWLFCVTIRSISRVQLEISGLGV